VIAGPNIGRRIGGSNAARGDSPWRRNRWVLSDPRERISESLQVSMTDVEGRLLEWSGPAPETKSDAYRCASIGLILLQEPTFWRLVGEEIQYIVGSRTSGGRANTRGRSATYSG
jgi:hypothetical protein